MKQKKRIDFNQYFPSYTWKDKAFFIEYDYYKYQKREQKQKTYY
jgi:hypothetical protein